jgi:hypothetical protein
MRHYLPRLALSLTAIAAGVIGALLDGGPLAWAGPPLVLVGSVGAYLALFEGK